MLNERRSGSKGPGLSRTSRHDSLAFVAVGLIWLVLRLLLILLPLAFVANLIRLALS